MKCPKCNADSGKNKVVCPECGYPLRGDNTENDCNENVDNLDYQGSKDNESLETKETISISKIFIFSLLGVCLLILMNGSISQSEQFKFLGNMIEIIVSILIIFFAIKMSSKVKDIVLSIGRKLLDIGTALDVVLAIGIIIAGLFITNDEYSPFEIGIEWYIIGSIVFLLFALLKDYVLYLLIDIRDSLKKIADRENENSK